MRCRICPSETSSSFIQIDTKTPGQHVRIYSFGGTKCKPISCGIIVGYSFEGHCYDLPKPKIMFIPAAPRDIPVDDCGYDVKYVAAARDKYRLWIVDKLDECIEFEMNQGFVEQLVLDANLPGKRFSDHVCVEDDDEPPQRQAGRIGARASRPELRPRRSNADSYIAARTALPRGEQRQVQTADAAEKAAEMPGVERRLLVGSRQQRRKR